MIEQADRPFASDRFGTTAEEQEEGEPLNQRLAEEAPSRRALDSGLEIEDFDAPDDEAELVGEGTFEHDPFVAPEEAAMSIRREAPGPIDHPDDDGDFDPYDDESEEI